MLRNKLLGRNELYSKSSLKSQSLKQKVTNPQTQERSFSWFVLFALLIWVCVHSVSSPHPLVPAIPLNVPMLSLRGGTTHTLGAMVIWNIPSLQLPPQQTFWTPHPPQICILFIFLLRWVLSKPQKNDGNTSSDLNSSHPVCVACLSKNLGSNMPFSYCQHWTTELASLWKSWSLGAYITRQHPQGHLPKLLPALPLHACFSETLHQACKDLDRGWRCCLRRCKIFRGYREVFFCALFLF